MVLIITKTLGSTHLTGIVQRIYPVQWKQLTCHSPVVRRLQVPIWKRAPWRPIRIRITWIRYTFHCNYNRWHHIPLSPSRPNHHCSDHSYTYCTHRWHHHHHRRRRRRRHHHHHHHGHRHHHRLPFIVLIYIALSIDNSSWREWNIFDSCVLPIFFFYFQGCFDKIWEDSVANPVRTTIVLVAAFGFQVMNSFNRVFSMRLSVDNYCPSLCSWVTGNDTL